MQITHIVESTGGGVLSMLRLLANGQAAQGHQVTVIYSRRYSTPADLRLQFSDRVVLVEIDMLTALGRFAAVPRLARLVRQQNADAVFLHSSFAGFLGRLALLFNQRIRIFYIPHGISLLRRDIGPIKRRAFTWLEKFAALRQTTILACSESEKTIIETRLGSADCLVVENAVASGHTKAVPEPVAKREQLVINIARITAAKNPDRFAAIANAAARVAPHIKFVWVGDGEIPYRHTLQRANVEITGWLEPAEVRRWLDRAALLLSTSDWEGMPVALMEAQLAGTPVLASRCSGNVDVIEDKVSGWLYEDPEDAVQILTTLLADLTAWEEITRSTRERALERYSPERYLNDMSTLLNIDPDGLRLA